MNYLLPIINSYFKEIAKLEGKLILSNIFIETFGNSLKTDLSFKHDSMTYYYDLSLPKGSDNLLPTGYTYHVDPENLQDEISNILSKEFCLTISQAYEIFETFLLNILVEFLYNNQSFIVNLNLSDTNIFIDKKELREKLKYKKGKNNRQLISFLRKIANNFIQHANWNTWEKEMPKWFDLVSEVRHNIIHNRQIISIRFLNYLEKHKANKLFERYFSIKIVDGESSIFQTQHQAMENIDLLNEFAFLIFKSVSVNNGLDERYQRIL